MAAATVLDREFLEVRSRLLDLAAALDRVAREGASAGGDPRLRQIAQALEILSGATPDRAEKVQQVFSRPYDPSWREVFEI